MSELETHTVDKLLADDFSFKRLYEKHNDLKQQVLNAHEGILHIDDMTLERMKKEKLLLKDQMAKKISEFQTHQALA